MGDGNQHLHIKQEQEENTKLEFAYILTPFAISIFINLFILFLLMKMSQRQLLKMFKDGSTK